MPTLASDRLFTMFGFYKRRYAQVDFYYVNVYIGPHVPLI